MTKNHETLYTDMVQHLRKHGGPKVEHWTFNFEVAGSNQRVDSPMIFTFLKVEQILVWSPGKCH